MQWVYGSELHPEQGTVMINLDLQDCQLTVKKPRVGNIFFKKKTGLNSTFRTFRQINVEAGLILNPGPSVR